MIGVLCGMESEASLVRHKGLCVAIGAGRPDIARRDLERVLHTGVVGIASFGMAGALATGLAPGTVVIGTEVIDAEGIRRPATERFVRVLENRFPGARRGPVLGVDRPILGAAAKSAAYSSTGALAVDMESHLVARRADELGIRFAILRAIVDDWATDVPAVLAGAMDERGKVRVLMVAMAVLTGRVRIGNLLELRRNFESARRALLGGGAALASLGD